MHIKNGKVKKLLFTGGVTTDVISEAEKMKQLAMQNGVNEEDIILEEKSRYTVENFGYSVKLLEKLKSEGKVQIDSVAIITSDFHLTRSYHLFRKFLNIVNMKPRIFLIGSKGGVKEEQFRNEVACSSSIYFNIMASMLPEGKYVTKPDSILEETLSNMREDNI